MEHAIISKESFAIIGVKLCPFVNIHLRQGYGGQVRG
jgi:hypothetical protein